MKKNISFLCIALILAITATPTFTANQSFLKKGSIESKIWNGAKIVFGAAALISAGLITKQYFNHYSQENTNKVKEALFLTNVKLMSNAYETKYNTKLTAPGLQNLKNTIKEHLQEKDSDFGVSIEDAAIDTFNQLPNPHSLGAKLSIPAGLAGIACIASGINGLIKDFAKN